MVENNCYLPVSSFRSMRYPPFTTGKLNMMRWFLGKKRKSGFFRWSLAVAFLGACAAFLFMVKIFHLAIWDKIEAGNVSDLEE